MRLDGLSSHSQFSELERFIGWAIVCFEIRDAGNRSGREGKMFSTGLQKANGMNHKIANCSTWNNLIVSGCGSAFESVEKCSKEGRGQTGRLLWGKGETVNHRSIFSKRTIQKAPRLKP